MAPCFIVLGVLTALLAQTGCDATPIAWRSPMGVTMEKEGLPGYFTPAEVDLFASHDVEGLARLGYSTDSLLEGVKAEYVWVWPDAIPCPTAANQNRLCNGLMVWQTLWVAAQPCVYDTALGHEMLHQLLQWETGDPDANHTRKDVWALDVPLGDCPAQGDAA